MAATERFRESYPETERDNPQAQHADNHPTGSEQRYVQDITEVHTTTEKIVYSMQDKQQGNSIHPDQAFDAFPQNRKPSPA